MNQQYFSELFQVLGERAKLAAISRLGFANVALRRYLAEVFDRPYGEPGTFLADPTFEAVFGWRKAEFSMAALEENLLSPPLVHAMDAPPPELARDYRFDRTQHPYRHQLEAWRILAQPIPQSLVVASGTGSGKTECFMVPILDRLVRLREEQQDKLTGVRALFLYPLNALINSQRERLRAWTHTFGGDIRFCLYNGNTPESLPMREHQEHPNEVLDRERLRASPPPILVTNATMLEYMLVRTADAPILTQSKGKLEWVVLDEAHTYVGSQAAEAALLIRRVLFAFGVAPEQVHFIATSATIGDPEGEAGRKLKRFLADVAGVSPDRVHLVAGQRRIPTLEVKKAEQTNLLSELIAIEPDQEISAKRYNALARDRMARKLRDLFVANPEKPAVARLSEVCALLFGSCKTYSRGQQQEALRWLDLLSGTRDDSREGRDDGEIFLPLRAHLFHQTMSGLWACADQVCPEKHASVLNEQQWPFGQLFFEPRKHCDCGSPAYEVVVCGDCGMVHLLAGEYQGCLTHFQPPAALDEFELEVEPGEDHSEEASEDDEQTAKGRQHQLLIVNRDLPHVGSLTLDRATRRITESLDNTLRVLAQEDDGDGLSCPACGGRSRPDRQLFQHSRLGAPFLLGGILPSLLEFAPDGDKPADHPCRGRRLLTFNDSRQGTARIAAKLQQDAERNRVRGLVYHLSLQYGRGQTNDKAIKLQNELITMESIAVSAHSSELDALIATKRAELSDLNRPTSISFNDLAQSLTNQGRDFDYMLNHYRRQAPGTFNEASGPIELARMFLVREFGRRPKRLNNLESMGLIAVRYPLLETINQLPSGVTQVSDFDLQTWRDFLKLCLDFFVRGGGSLEISPMWRNWLGIPFPQSQLVARDELNVARNQRRWPRARRSGMSSTLVRLLAYVLMEDITTSRGEDRIDAILQEAWNSLISANLLRQSGDGRVLPLDRLAFMPMPHAWICPVTRRFLDTTLRGITPYLPLQANTVTAECQKVNLPLYDEPFAGVTDDLERIRQGRKWLASHEDIIELRDQGVWSDLNDRVIELTPYFTAAEHSAQQDSRTLERYEKVFKAGDLNLLSCSTTMEMGIDIGGISLVAMNNVPPHPANYLQRAGRAGRRKEARSLAMTLCKSNPHDQAVFSNSKWAFDTTLPAPRVSLDSPIIVQRHVQSLLLSQFLAEKLQGSGQEQTRLTCGFFFLGDMPLADHFSAWCRALSKNEDQKIFKGLRQLLRHTMFEGSDLGRIMNASADAIEELALGWRLEWSNLDKEIQETLSAGVKSPIYLALTLRINRLTGEYLLRELATRGYLPVYGFPSHIASFDNLTKGQFLRAPQQDKVGRDDNRYRRRELASRDIMTALREYAPGSEVVMDGLVYRSAGVTLNWHIPADKQDVHEIQDIRFAWRCTHCGASGASHSLEAAKHCNACGTEVSHIREYLEPSGFATDFYKEPTNDVTKQHFVPVEAPWIDASGDWVLLPNPTLGRLRVSTNGHVFHQSRGINGNGYALCLECGRAEPMMEDGGLPTLFQHPHYKLRRASDEGLYCRGSQDTWKIKQGITLGHETWTDVLEIQLRLVNGVWLNNAIAARTLAVALRDALAELIGIQTTELGCDIKEARVNDGSRCQSVLIFDRFAAGYVSSVDRYLQDLFKKARNRLECPAACDSACPHCILDFDQRFAADKLDRREGLEVLTDLWLKNLILPEGMSYFGHGSRPEYRRLSEAIWYAVSRHRAGGVRFYTAGTADTWDIGPSPLRELVYRLCGQGIDVEIVMTKPIIESLDEADRYLLASLADHTKVTIRVVDQLPRCGEGWLVAETMGSSATRWALPAESCLAFNLDWGRCEGPLIAIDFGPEIPSPGETVSAELIRPKNNETGDREIEIHHELDGSIKGFGNRFWKHVFTQHSSAHELLVNGTDEIISFAYHDRYLFTPLSVALLLEVVIGLKNMVSQGRWNVEYVKIFTTSRRGIGDNKVRNTVWSDWPDTGVRDRVLDAAFRYKGIATSLQLAENSALNHGRLLELKLASGKKLTVRLDQGISYWRASRSERGESYAFDPHVGDAVVQAARLAKLVVSIVGAHLPTQLFIKVR